MIQWSSKYSKKTPLKQLKENDIYFFIGKSLSLRVRGSQLRVLLRQKPCIESRFFFLTNADFSIFFFITTHSLSPQDFNFLESSYQLLSISAGGTPRRVEDSYGEKLNCHRETQSNFTINELLKTSPSVLFLCKSLNRYVRHKNVPLGLMSKNNGLSQILFGSGMSNLIEVNSSRKFQDCLIGFIAGWVYRRNGTNFVEGYLQM